MVVYTAPRAGWGWSFTIGQLREAMAAGKAVAHDGLAWRLAAIDQHRATTRQDPDTHPLGPRNVQQVVITLVLDPVDVRGAWHRSRRPWRRQILVDPGPAGDLTDGQLARVTLPGGTTAWRVIDLDDPHQPICLHCDRLAPCPTTSAIGQPEPSMTIRPPETRHARRRSSHA